MEMKRELVFHRNAKKCKAQRLNEVAHLNCMVWTRGNTSTTYNVTQTICSKIVPFIANPVKRIIDRWTVKQACSLF